MTHNLYWVELFSSGSQFTFEYQCKYIPVKNIKPWGGKIFLRLGGLNSQ